ncbi:MAG: lipase/acyltransferase domain-containing protein, partial [Candidatus Paceibacterota bacterium]
MNKAGLWLSISWFTFLIFLFPFFASADATFEIPYTLNLHGRMQCEWDLSSYNASNNFYSYGIGKDGALISSGRTSGQTLCQDAFIASTASGGDLFFEAGAGEYKLTLYAESGLRDPYGYMVFDCPADGICAMKKLTSVKTWHSHLTEDTTWEAAESPYLVDQLTVDSGVSLRIEHGALVLFRNKSSFLYVVEGGTLDMRGTSEAPITLSTINDDGDVYLPARGDWDNVINYGTLTATHVHLSYTTHGFINHAPGVLTLDQSSVREVRNYAVLQQSGTTSITNSTIENSGSGVGQVAGEMYIFNSNLSGIDALAAYNKQGEYTAVNNYWGHASGPHALYSNEPSGTGEDIGERVLYVPWVSSAPTEPRYMGCIIDCFSNVLFLPGMMASRLYEADEELWFSRSDESHEKMALDQDGNTEATVYTFDDTTYDGSPEKGILEEVSLAHGVFNPDIYKSFVKDLEAWRTSEALISRYAFVPYDWRLSLEDIIENGQVTNQKLSYSDDTRGGRYIINKLAELARYSRTGKVTIVAHSNGGLVAKQLIYQLQKEGNPLAEKIDRLILVAVPQLGTPEAVVTMLHGVKVSKGLVMSAEMSRFLAENFPVIYNLLPSDAYFLTVDTTQSPLVTFENVEAYASQVSQYGTEITTPVELLGYLLGTDARNKPAREDTEHTNIASASLYDQAKKAHDIIDNWQPPAGLKIIQVAGWGEETKSNLEYKEYFKFGGLKYSSYKVNTTIDGDHTVVEPSALWMSPNVNPNVERWWVNLAEVNRGKPFFRTEHKDILEVKSLRDFIKAKIIGYNFVDEKEIVVPQKPASDAVKKLLHFTLHSPLALGVYDTEGRYTGLDLATGEVLHEIPDVYYEQIGEVQFLSVPVGVKFLIKLDGYEEGSFALDIEEQGGNSITTSTIFEG